MVSILVIRPELVPVCWPCRLRYERHPNHHAWSTKLEYCGQDKKISGYLQAALNLLFTVEPNLTDPQLEAALSASLSRFGWRLSALEMRVGKVALQPR